jgi:hypothetical protein
MGNVEHIHQLKKEKNETGIKTDVPLLVVYFAGFTAIRAILFCNKKFSLVFLKFKHSKAKENPGIFLCLQR